MSAASVLRERVRQSRLLAQDPALTSAYREYDRRLRLRYSKASCVLVGLLVPAGVSLDYFMYPSMSREFLVARLAVGLVALAVLALHHTAFGARYVQPLGWLPPLLTNVVICWMIYRTEGAASPYYAGLNLVLFGIAVLLPWSFLEALLVAFVTLSLYFLASTADSRTVGDSPVFFNNVYFIVLASVICCTSAFMKSRGRRLEFELQAQLARSNAQLTHMERLKTQFFANISHELRTPLTLILSPLEDTIRRHAAASADSGPVDAALANSVEDVHISSALLHIAYQNALRLLKLINDLLEFIRIDAAERSAHKEPIEIGQFTTAQVEALRPLAGLQELELRLEPFAQPVWVSCDRRHLERILVNLLTNAIKYTPAGGRVWVRVTARADAALVEVADTGIGISEEDLAVIFNRFRQAENARSMSARGMGIGLALAKELCEENDGKIVARSRLGKGTSMMLELPLVPAPAGASAGVAASRVLEPAGDPISAFSLKADRSPMHGHQHASHDLLGFAPGAEVSPASEAVEAEAGPASSADDPASASTPRVLVVDDERDIRRYIAHTLATDYRLLEAGDGRSGLELALRFRPDVMIVDQMMPDIEGIELCARMRQEPEELRPRVIMVTARADDSTRLSALARGADDFLEKPFSGPELALRVSNLARARRLEQRLREQNQQLEAALERIKEAELELVANEKFAALGRMAGGLLHELNNPLNNALMAVALAGERARSADAQSREIIADAELGLRRVRDVIAAVRTFSYPGGHAGRFQRLLLNRLIEVAHAQMRQELDGLTVHLSIPDDTWVSGIEAQLIQVLANILANAAEAIQRSGVGDCVEIRVDLLEDRASVQILDNGPGIPEELRKRVLEPFVTSKPPGEGMGLGLAICDRLVRNHNSGIMVRSRPEGGTSISFELQRSERTIE
jgi:signal transduction histidine kinase